MKSQREIEIKLEVPQQALTRLTRNPLLRKAPNRTKRSAVLASVYYDTETHKLRKYGLTLRVRRIGRRYVQTIKRSNDNNSALMNRSEWEFDIVGSKPNLATARRISHESIFSNKLQAKLKPLFETRVRRRFYLIRNGGSDIEVSIDQGTIMAGLRSSPICEVELELKRGNAVDLFKVARALTEQVPAQLVVTSKSERGYALIARKKKPKAVDAIPVVILPDTNCQHAFQVSSQSCLHQVLANQCLVRNGEPDGIHQVRVGLRRLRAAISLFEGMLLDPQSSVIERELKWIALELGPAREIDVFIKRVVTPASAGSPKPAGIATLTHELRLKRREAFGRARSAVESDRFRKLTLDCAAWIEAGDWTRNADDLACAIRNQSIESVAAAEMERRWKKIVRRGRTLAKADPAQRHKMRIRTKKLRYAAEFFAATFPGKKRARRRREFITALEQLQDTLGDLNDISVHEGLTERLAGSQENGKKRKLRTTNKAFAAGRMSGREEARIASVLKDAERAYSCFIKAKPFWW